MKKHKLFALAIALLMPSTLCFAQGVKNDSTSRSTSDPQILWKLETGG